MLGDMESKTTLKNLNFSVKLEIEVETFTLMLNVLGVVYVRFTRTN